MKKLLILARVGLLVMSGCASLNPITPFKGSQVLVKPETGEE